MASAPKKARKAKRADVSGWCPETLDKRLKHMNKNKPLGGWRLDVQLHNLHHKIAQVRWTYLPQMKTFTFPGPVPVGMEKLLAKLESAQNRTFNVIPLAVREEFCMSESSYKSTDYAVEVTFSAAKYGNFRILYCRQCTTKQNLREMFWNKYPDKLPSDNISLQTLMAHWDELNLTWNSQDVLGCILPNNPKHFALVNARRMIQRPIIHFDTVHRESKPKNRKSKIIKPLSPPSSTITSSETSFSSPASTDTEPMFAASCSSLTMADSSSTTSCSSSSIMTSSSSSTAISLSSSEMNSSSSSTFSMKHNHRKSDLRQQTIEEVVPETKMDFIGHFPQNTNEEMALGQALKIIHVGANKMISSAAVLENYQATMEIKQEQWQYYHSLNASAIRKGDCLLPSPIKVRLNPHNINDGYSAILSAYRNHKNDDDNPYRILENVSLWGFIHDATSHWVKELNTVILRAVDDQGYITKVPFNFNQVPGSLTGEVLANEIMENISLVRKVKNNASEKISAALKSSALVDNSESQKKLEVLREQFKVAANALDFENSDYIKATIQDLQKEMSNAQHSSIKKDTIIPIPPHYFRISTLKGIDHSEHIIYLEISPSNVPTAICGDRCATNVKSNRLITEWYGITSPEADCSSHAASGTIRRTCTSATMSDPDAVTIYKALRKILKHFSQSPKSTELLNKALDALELNNIHMLVWGGTRMAGFLDACKQSSSILVPFLDTLITGNIRDEETAIILSPKGLFTLELFADLHSVFSNQYLHCVDSDKILSCEVFDVAHRTANKLVDPSLKTPKADNIFKNLNVDNNNNICVTLKNPDAADDNEEPSTHTHLLNEKLTRHRTFEDVKEGLLSTKHNILHRLKENITDQVDNKSIFYLFSVFDLKSRESLDEKCDKLKALYEIYGKDNTHLVSEKWFDFEVSITYKARLKCTCAELIEQFKIGHEKMTSLARELRQDRLAGGELTQHCLWVKFIKLMGMQCPDLCDMVLIMISIPPNSGWVERAYSYLEMICQKRRNQMKIESPLKELFFLAQLKLEPRDCQGYKREIKILSKLEKCKDEDLEQV